MAEHLDVTVEELFRTKLAVDWFEAEMDIEETVYVLAPATQSMEPGGMYPGNPRGRCVFLTSDNRCEVHAAKPFECRRLLHTDTSDQVHNRHLKVARAWQQFQKQVRKLLGHEPCESEWEGGFWSLFG
jgi:Fe-S-cluster containining protein